MDPIIFETAAKLIDKYFDFFSAILKRLRLGVSIFGVSIELQKESSIDERIEKIEEAKTSLLEGVRLIDELRQAAEKNKREAEFALNQIALLENDKASIEKELKSIKQIAQSDIDTFRKMAGVPSSDTIRKERIIGFVSGVVSSLVASGVIWVVVEIFNQ